MAKKILGDDPFSAKKNHGAGDEKKSRAKVVQKTKRAPSRKTEAPRISATKAEKLRPAKKTVEPKLPKKIEANAAPGVEPAVAPQAEAASLPAEAIDAAATKAVPVRSKALAPRLHDHAFDEPPIDAAPGSWRWWRYRQVQLARAEEATWLAHAEKQPGGDRFGRDPVLAGRAEPIVDVLYRSWLRVSVRGLGHVPESGRAILVVRRRRPQFTGLRGAAIERLGRLSLERLGLDGSFGTAMDAAIIGHAIRTEHVAHRELRPLVRPARLYTPFVGSLLRKLGGVSSDLHDFARLLDDDRLALAFVDDRATTRRNDVLDLSTIVSLALVTGAPIVPVVIGSSPSEASRGRFGLFGGRPSVTALAFGTPIFPGAEFGPEGAEDEALVQRLAGELGAQL